MDERSFWMQYRMGHLQVLDAIERKLGMEVTTADIRLWFRYKGPQPKDAKKEIEELRREIKKGATTKGREHLT